MNRVRRVNASLDYFDQRKLEWMGTLGSGKLNDQQVTTKITIAYRCNTITE